MADPSSCSQLRYCPTIPGLTLTLSCEVKRPLSLLRLWPTMDPSVHVSVAPATNRLWRNVISLYVIHMCMSQCCINIEIIAIFLFNQHLKPVKNSYQAPEKWARSRQADYSSLIAPTTWLAQELWPSGMILTPPRPRAKLEDRKSFRVSRCFN